MLNFIGSKVFIRAEIYRTELGLRGTSLNRDLRSLFDISTDNLNVNETKIVLLKDRFPDTYTMVVTWSKTSEKKTRLGTYLL